jgi:hypothetical protein
LGKETGQRESGLVFLHMHACRLLRLDLAGDGQIGKSEERGLGLGESHGCFRHPEEKEALFICRSGRR